MSLPDILNVGIGLVLLFFLLSTIASLVVEIITTVAHYREEILQVTIHRLLLGGPDRPWRMTTLLYDRAVAWVVPNVPLMQGVRTKLRPDASFDRYTPEKNGQKILEAFWTHAKIRSLVPNDAQAPAKLAADTFAQVLIDIAVPKNTQGELPDNRLALDRALAIPTADLPIALRETLRGLTLSSEIPAGATGEKLWLPFRASLAAWYDEASRQATEIYRKKMKTFLLVVGLALAVALNADAVRTVKILSTNGSLRDATAAYATTIAAEKQASAEGDEAAKASLQDVRKKLGTHLDDLRKLEEIGFPLGWTDIEWNEMLGRPPEGSKGKPPSRQPALTEATPVQITLREHRTAIVVAFLLKLLGLLATGLAVAQGGPFWYDLMQKLVGLRKGTGGEAGAEDKAGAEPTTQPAANGKVVPATPLPLEIGYDLTKPATGFSARKAYWLARCSQAAYSPKPEIAALVRMNWHFHDFEFFDVDGSQGFLAADDKIVVVAFRGTELSDIRDALEDAKVALKELAAGEVRRVHTGFWDSYHRLGEGLLERIRSLPPQESPRQIYLTGHSLGGGMATVMFALVTLLLEQEQDARTKYAQALMQNKAGASRAPAGALEPPSTPPDTGLSIPTLYTFGCPKVGNAEFARQLDKQYPGRIFRVENNLDIVPQVPPLPKYHHVGARAHLEADGRLVLNPSGMSLLLAEVMGAITKDNLKDVPAEKFAAHGVSNYVALCENLAKAVV